MDENELPEQVDWEQLARLTRRLLLLLATGDDVEVMLQADESLSSPTGLRGHIHQSFWEIRLFRPSDEEPIDHIVLIPPGVRHHLMQQPGRMRSTHYRIGENLLEATWIYPGYGRLPAQPLQLWMVLRHLEMMQDYRHAYGDQAQDFLNSQTHFLGRALLALVDSVGKCLTGRRETLAVQGNSTYVAALKYIQAHYRDPALTIADIARFAGVCENGLSRIFRKHLGLSARRYLMVSRLAEACNFLVQGVPASQASRLSGWNTAGYFLATFRKVTGMTVREFQKACGSGDIRMPEVLLAPTAAASAEME